jgi:hypothetical protein
MANFSEEITVKRTLDMLVALPPRLQRLYALYNRMSGNGARRVYATAEWIYRRLGCSRSTYYEWRAKLVEIGLIAVELRKLAPKWNAPSLVTVCSLKAIASRLWAITQFRMRPENRTQKQPFYSSVKSRARDLRRKPSALTQRLVRQGLQHNLC